MPVSFLFLLLPAAEHPFCIYKAQRFRIGRQKGKKEGDWVVKLRCTGVRGNENCADRRRFRGLKVREGGGGAATKGGGKKLSTETTKIEEEERREGG